MHRVMVSYLKASKEQRALMEAAMPDILTPEVCEELASADALIRDSSEAAKDALSYGNSLLKEVSSNPAPIPNPARHACESDVVGDFMLRDDDGNRIRRVGGAPYNDDDGDDANTNAYEDDDLMGEGLTTFEEILAGLMAKQDEAMAMMSGGAAAGGSAATAASSSGAAGASAVVALAGRAEEQTKERAGCVLLPAALLAEVFAYLPIMDIIEVAEHVCHYWNNVTTVSTTAQAFWIGCVHREYPSQLATLVASEGPTLFEADWRTIATVIVCNELAEEFGDEEDDDAVEELDE